MCDFFLLDGYCDALSKNYCNDFYALPEGTEDISLTGRNCFNPGTGNAFRFDNNDQGKDSLKHSPGGVPYYTYTFENPDDAQTYHFSVFMYKSEKASWLVQFAVFENQYKELSGDILAYAESVTFAE